MIDDKDKEYATIITREMIAMMLNEKIELEDRAKIMVSILSDGELDDPMMQAFADSLRIGFEKTNDIRKKSIENRRKRQAEYQRKSRQKTTESVDRHQSTTENEDERPSTQVSVDERPSTLPKRSSTHYAYASAYAYAKAKANANNNISPYNPPKGEGKEPPILEPEEILVPAAVGGGPLGAVGGGPLDPQGATPGAEAGGLQGATALAEEIEQTEAFAHMRVSRRKLLRALKPVLKKNTAAEIREGIERWTAVWAADGWRYAPGSMSQWIADGKFLQEPRALEPARPDEEVGVKEIV